MPCIHWGLKGKTSLVQQSFDGVDLVSPQFLFVTEIPEFSDIAFPKGCMPQSACVNGKAHALRIKALLHGVFPVLRHAESLLDASVERHRPHT